MKKFLAIFLTALLCLTTIVTLIACTPDSFEDEGITVELYTNMGGNLSQIVSDYIKEFNNMYPNIKIKHTPIGGQYSDLNTRVDTELGSDKGPALTYCYPDHVAGYMDKGNKVVCLDTYINSTETVPVGKFGNTQEYPIGLTQEQIDDFFPAFYNEGKESYGDGTKMYSLPFAKSTEVVYYNQTFFDEHDLKHPDHWFANTANVDEDKTSMEYVCKRILEIDPQSVPLGYDSEDNFFITLAAQLETLPENAGKHLYTTANTTNPREHYLFDNPEMREMMLKINKWYQKGYFGTQGTNGGYMSSAFTGQDKNAPRCYMCIGSTGGATYQVPASDAFDIELGLIPQLNPDQPRVISQGPSICMLRNENNMTKDQLLASWLWLKFMTTNEFFQARISMANGYSPVLKSVLQNEYYYDNYLSLPEGQSNDDRVKAMAVNQCLAQSNAYFTSPAFPGSAEARTQVGTLLVNCIQEKGTDEQLSQKIQSAFTTALKACQLYGIK